MASSPSISNSFESGSFALTDAELDSFPIVDVLSSVLSLMCDAADKRFTSSPKAVVDHLNACESITVFETKALPQISFAAYVHRIRQYAQCPVHCFVVALIYIDRLIGFREGFAIHSLNFHRLFLTSAMLSTKFYEDAFFNNKYWAKVGGVSNAELNAQEAFFLRMINWDFNVTTAVYNQYFSELYQFALNKSSLPASPASPIIPTPVKQIESAPAPARALVRTSVSPLSQASTPSPTQPSNESSTRRRRKSMEQEQGESSPEEGGGASYPISRSAGEPDSVLHSKRHQHQHQQLHTRLESQCTLQEKPATASSASHHAAASAGEYSKESKSLGSPCSCKSDDGLSQGSYCSAEDLTRDSSVSDSLFSQPMEMDGFSTRGYDLLGSQQHVPVSDIYHAPQFRETPAAPPLHSFERQQQQQQFPSQSETVAKQHVVRYDQHLPSTVSHPSSKEASLFSVREIRSPSISYGFSQPVPAIQRGPVYDAKKLRKSHSTQSRSSIAREYPFQERVTLLEDTKVPEYDPVSRGVYRSY